MNGNTTQEGIKLDLERMHRVGLRMACSSRMPAHLQRPSHSHPGPAAGETTALATGASVLQLFDRVEALESTAEALINWRAIGELTPMPDNVIRELASRIGGS